MTIIILTLCWSSFASVTVQNNPSLSHTAPFQRQLFSDWLVRVNSRFEPQMGGASLYDITQMQE